MEEKNVSKISLLTFFIILAIIVIIVMGIFIYKLNNDKKEEIQKSTELQSQVNSLNGTVSNLQGKVNNISETIEDKTTTSETLKNKIVKEENNNTSKELTLTEILQNIYSKNNGNISMKFSYITLTTKYSNNESEVEITVNENNFRDSVGKVKLGLDPSSGANRNIDYTNLKEKIVDVLIDVNSDGSISAITLLTANGKAYTTPWGYRYNNTQAELFEMGNNIVRLSYDDKGGCGYDKNGKVVFHTEDIYRDGE